MRINFGQKIAVVYVSFVVFILFFVFRSCEIASDLEEEDYYEKELTFGEDIKAQENFNQLGEGFTFFQENSFTINIPKVLSYYPEINYALFFKRPSGKELDYQLTTQAQNQQIIVPWDSVSRGMYQLEVRFELDNEAYLYKEKINLNPKK